MRTQDKHRENIQEKAEYLAIEKKWKKISASEK